MHHVPIQVSDDKHPSSTSLMAISYDEYVLRLGKYMLATSSERKPDTLNSNRSVMATVLNGVPGKEKQVLSARNREITGKQEQDSDCGKTFATSTRNTGETYLYRCFLLVLSFRSGFTTPST